jgi:hypothetical protein
LDTRDLRPVVSNPFTALWRPLVDVWDWRGRPGAGHRQFRSSF